MGPFLFSISCGPNAEELEAQRIADDTRFSDSLAKVQVFQQAEADSLAKAENPSLVKDISLNTKTPADKKLIKTAELKFQVGNVWRSTELIEDITAKYEGYITFSNLQNRNINYSRTNISRDSILEAYEIVVENEIRLRVPNVNLDSFIRELTPLVKFLDYRVIKMDDVTFQFASIEKKGERFKTYEKRQTSHIDNKNSKFKEASAAEENLFERQLQADEIALKAKQLDDQLKYCNITIEIYQKPVIHKEVKADFTYVSSTKPNFFKRFVDSIVQGYWILEEFILFLVKIWGIILIAIGIFIGVRYLIKVTKKK